MKKRLTLKQVKEMWDKADKRPVKEIQTKFVYGDTNYTLDAWTGSGYYQHIKSIEVFGFRLVLWRKK